MKQEADKKPYEVLARKYRPKQFDEVAGQDHVTTTLKNAIRLKRVAHAYLFVGPRGIGKTSIARTAWAMLPFFLAMIVAQLFITFIPELSLWIPRLFKLI